MDKRFSTRLGKSPRRSSYSDDVAEQGGGAKRPPSSPARGVSPTKRRARQGKRSPGSSRERAERFEYSDRYIPCRDGIGGSPSQAQFGNCSNHAAAAAAAAAGPAVPSLYPDEDGTGNGNNGYDGPGGGAGSNSGGGARHVESIKSTYDMLLKNELLGSASLGRVEKDGFRSASSSPGGDKVFRFREAAGTVPGLGEAQSPFSLSPVGRESQRLLQSPRKSPRKIAAVPFKVLDAPDLQDDFYLNLVDWSSQNQLCVGLGSCVYLWSACTSKVTKLCDLSSVTDGESDTITSVNWMQRGSHLAVGTEKGLVHLWDAQKCKLQQTYEGHQGRVGTLAWNGMSLCSGSRDRSILQRDVRSPEQHVRKMIGHKQEVCGLRWSPDEHHLASGGNDNRLVVWRNGYDEPVHRFTQHTAAVKAIAWSPHQHGLLASGGGTADQKIRFWNTLTSQPLQCIDTKSQVCNLAWSKSVNEIVSTHGYSQNEIVVWKYPSMQQITVLTGHTLRVLYLAMSPDGQTIVTGAGDETLRFWNVFSKTRSPKQSKSVLNPFNHIR